MPHIFHKILQKVSGKSPDKLIPSPDQSTFEQVRLKTHSFQMLLSSCAQFWNYLDIIEQALANNKYFNMIYVRSISTQITLKVYSILKYQQEIGTKKPELISVFNKLRAEMKYIAGPEPAPGDEELTLHLSMIDARQTELVGNRMASLAKLENIIAGLRMPTGFVVTAAGYQSFLRHNNLQEEIKRLLQTWEVSSMNDLYSLSSHLQLLIINAQLPPELEKAIMQGYRQLEKETGYRGIKMALRPSTGIPDQNFPLESLIREEFNVGEEFLFRAYKEVVARKYSVPAINYRMRRGLKEEDLSICVGCLAMINTKVSGSINFRDPQQNGPAHLIIRALPGVDASLSQSITQPDMWKINIDAPKIIFKKITEKKKKQTFFLSEEGLNLVSVPANQQQEPSLTDKQIMDLTGIASLIRSKMGGVGKIKWALDSHDVFTVLEVSSLRESSFTDLFDQPVDANKPDRATLGQKISVGRASGKVYIADKNVDILEFPAKSILIVKESWSGWASLVPWASAVITEEAGDPLGHLACMAREFEIPALFGSKDATKIFRPGQMITVDGHTGETFPCSDENGPPCHLEDEKHPLKGTPVFQALESVVRITGTLSQTNPLQERNIKQLNLHEVAHLSHLSATATLIDIAISNINKHDPLYGKAESWHVWDLTNPLPPRTIKHENLHLISSTPLKAFVRGTKNDNTLHFIPRKDPSITRRFLSTSFTAQTFFDPIFSRPAHIMFTGKFVHICFECANIGVMVQAGLQDYAPENFIFLLIQKNKSGPLITGLGLENILSRDEFFIRHGKNHFLARISGKEHKQINSRLIFLGRFLAGVSQISESRPSSAELESMARKILSGTDMP